MYLSNVTNDYDNITDYDNTTSSNYTDMLNDYDNRHYLIVQTMKAILI